MKITHYDLFAGIGGFSYAVDQVYGKENTKHIFVENNPFCQAVLKTHWPEGEYWGDIREFIAHTRSEEQRGLSDSERKEISSIGECSILTGGFPCQPFSHAGKRHGTQDNRYLWPEMFRVIQLVNPQWVIAENVYGLLTIEGGLVFEQVCSDLEAEGYEVQTLIIPAVSVNAPHRRDRVWIIAHAISNNNRTQKQRKFFEKTVEQNKNRAQISSSGQPCRTNTIWRNKRFKKGFSRRDWERDWKEVAFATCNDRVDDGFRSWLAGLPRDIDDIMMGYVTPKNTGTIQILSCLREAIQSPKIREQIRGLYSVEEEEVLFEVLRKFKEVCGRRRLFSKSKKTQKESLQSLWLKQFIKQIEHSPQRRRYYEQQARKLTNIMSQLSYETALAITKIGHCFWLLYAHLYPQKMGKEINGQRMVRLPDGTRISYAKWRQEGLKAFGNAIVPQVAIEILKAIRSSEHN
jgi:DNA-cytosine methyltransferase